MSAPLAPRYWPVWIGFGFLYLWHLLPWPVAMAAGRRLGGLLRLGLKSRVKVTRRNLELCFPEATEAEREQMLKETFESVGCMLPEAGFAWFGSQRRINRLSSVTGTEYLDQAQAEGQGVLLLAAHFTTLEIGGRIICRHDKESKAAIYREHSNPALEYLVRKYRSGYAGTCFNRNETRGAVRHLRRGRLLWYAPDQDYERGQSLFLPFFGIQAYTSTSAHQLATLGRARVLTVRQRRTRQGYELAIEPPLAGIPGPNVEEDCARINEVMERIIREAPTQYLWLHRRFKNRPEGEASLYG
ncbi:MAG: LpxL/LpxP family Kdo(2)-lipid IV(A) lauroyl/palmitoleoyl acyltransferase [Pseudomonadota bacterium]